MNCVRSNNLGLKYHRFTVSGYKNIGIRKFEFVTFVHQSLKALKVHGPFNVRFRFYQKIQNLKKLTF